MKERERELLSQLSAPMDQKIATILRRMHDEHRHLLQSQLTLLRRECEGRGVPTQTVTLSHSDAMTPGWRRGHQRDRATPRASELSSDGDADHLDDGAHEIVMATDDDVVSSRLAAGDEIVTQYVDEQDDVIISDSHEVVMSSSQAGDDGTVEEVVLLEQSDVVSCQQVARRATLAALCCRWSILISTSCLSSCQMRMALREGVFGPMEERRETLVLYLTRKECAKRRK
ncbi:PREDICTED: uncharacterized protein LOC106810599 [Priapulus caudatus]|uniref:Uncharacterized protein LOC106810599 n=1 Tax=Priapulus caudatus TaxID=37621 RepID=A0ABM1EBC2_PRICU|nr:PREDICTED: uncharacterized protein LOC106810599 [Priapulus caudatus]